MHEFKDAWFARASPFQSLSSEFRNDCIRNDDKKETIARIPSSFDN